MKDVNWGRTWKPFELWVEKKLKEYIISNETVNIRLDKALKNLVPDKSRSYLSAIILEAMGSANFT